MTKWGEGKVERICEHCGGRFLRYKAWVIGRSGRGGAYCSRECQTIGRPKRSKRVRPRFCKKCGGVFYVRKGRGGTSDYCSAQCRAIACGKLLSGNNHPNWKGGISNRTHASRVAIKIAIQEKGRCERCGSTERLQGHHKKSYANYPELRCNKENIEVVCEDCHAIEHPELASFIRGKKSGQEMDSRHAYEEGSFTQDPGGTNGTENTGQKVG